MHCRIRLIGLSRLCIALQIATALTNPTYFVGE